MRFRVLLVSGVLPALLLSSCTFPWSTEAVNPDPNHTHADFAVFVDGRQVDFSDARYMSEAPAAGESASHAYEEEDAVASGAALRNYLHLHDGVGTVIHRHKPGLTFGEFLASLGVSFRGECVTLENGREICDGESGAWRMVVNGEETEPDPAYVFEDTDRILLTFGADDAALAEQLSALGDDACLYSRTCPERGDPPAENCIADPEVPCVAPLE